MAKKASPSITSKKSSPTAKILDEVEKFVNKSPAKKKQSPVQMAYIPESIKKKSD